MAKKRRSSKVTGRPSHSIKTDVGSLTIHLFCGPSMKAAARLLNSARQASAEKFKNLLRLCGSAARLILRRVFDCVKHPGVHIVNPWDLNTACGFSLPEYCARFIQCSREFNIVFYFFGCGDGRAPICCSSDSVSATCHISTTLPSTIRSMAVPEYRTCLPVGAAPLNSPRCVP